MGVDHLQHEIITLFSHFFLFLLSPFSHSLLFFCEYPPIACPARTMSTSSATDFSSDFSSLSSSSPRPSPYHHPTPPSTLSLGSQRRHQDPMPTKTTRFYSSPLESDSDSTPLQIYGLEQRPSSMVVEEKSRLLSKVANALDDIKEDFPLQIDTRETAHKLKRQSTLIFNAAARPGSSSSACSSQSNASTPDLSAKTTTATPANPGGPPRSRTFSLISLDTWSSPSRGLRRRLTRRLSRKPVPPPKGTASISSPNLIGSSTQYASEQKRRPILLASVSS